MFLYLNICVDTSDQFPAKSRDLRLIVLSDHEDSIAHESEIFHQESENTSQGMIPGLVQVGIELSNV